LLAGITAVWLFLILSFAPCRAAAENLLLNPDLMSGSSMPDHWHPSPGVQCDSFEWSHQPGARGELRISDAPGGRAAWTQLVSLSAGWYYLSAEVRSEGIGEVFLALRSRSLLSPARWGWDAKDWEHDGFYVHITSSDQIEVQCGLDSPTHSAKAYFRDIQLSRISGSPLAGAQQMELDTASAARQFDQTPRWLNVYIISLLCLAGFVYYLFGDRAAETRSPQIEPKSVSMNLGRSGVIALFGILLFIFLILTRIEWHPGAGFSIVQPAVTMSDEPQYLLVINSLLFDHDLEVQDDYARVAEGGLEAGVHFRGSGIDHHSILVNRRTGRSAYTSIDAPNPAPPCDPAFSPPQDTYEVSAHPPAFPALIALAIAPLRPDLARVEGDAALVLALIAWLGALATYMAGRQLGMTRGKAMLATMLLVGASPWLPYSRSFFSESATGLALILAVWAYNADRMILAGFGAASAAVLKPPFAIVGLGFIVNELLEGRRRNAVNLLVVLASSGLLLVGFNYWLAKMLILSGNAGFTPFGFNHLYDTFLDPVHGLFYFAPWTLFVFLAIPFALRPHASGLKLVRQLVLPLIIYIALMSCTGPGLCYGPRYWVPFLPWFALATVQIVERARRPAVLACAVLVLLSALIAIPGGLRYPEMFSKLPWAAWK
jgi:hypothetical protein